MRRQRFLISSFSSQGYSMGIKFDGVMKKEYEWNHMRFIAAFYLLVVSELFLWKIFLLPTSQIHCRGDDGIVSLAKLSLIIANCFQNCSPLDKRNLCTNFQLDCTNKVITTIVIRPLDDPRWCAQSVVADLRPLSLGYVGIRMSSFSSPPMGSYWLSIDTYGRSLTVFRQNALAFCPYVTTGVRRRRRCRRC